MVATLGAGAVVVSGCSPVGEACARRPDASAPGGSSDRGFSDWSFSGRGFSDWSFSGIRPQQDVERVAPFATLDGLDGTRFRDAGTLVTERARRGVPGPTRRFAALRRPNLTYSHVLGPAPPRRPSAPLG